MVKTINQRLQVLGIIIVYYDVGDYNIGFIRDISM